MARQDAVHCVRVLLYALNVLFWQKLICVRACVCVFAADVSVHSGNGGVDSGFLERRPDPDGSHQAGGGGRADVLAAGPSGAGSGVLLPADGGHVGRVWHDALRPAAAVMVLWQPDAHLVRGAGQRCLDLRAAPRPALGHDQPEVPDVKLWPSSSSVAHTHLEHFPDRVSVLRRDLLHRLAGDDGDGVAARLLLLQSVSRMCWPRPPARPQRPPPGGLRSKDFLVHSREHAAASVAFPGRGHGRGPDPGHGAHADAAVGVTLRPQATHELALDVRWRRRRDSATRASVRWSASVWVGSEVRKDKLRPRT
ncbi:tetraspanin-12 isoform X2 [Dunckerocampus dactyliophorus]|uniref:tetraspanin-12 isoform X2 n=1 Tax=Dunckerocampus dactyliophorus TaxID=161453 RepID=UPI0024075462|nr:tetraspanin-12 isoform X2 [Dunckerocampus dactyliophorus]